MIMQTTVSGRLHYLTIMCVLRVSTGYIKYENTSLFDYNVCFKS